MNLLAKRGDNLNFPSLFSGFFDEGSWSKPLAWNGWKSNVPAANVLETDDEFRIELAAPGMEKKDFHVNIENGSLCITTEKELETNVGLKIDFDAGENYEVSGRGELHLSVLIETMRREGFELQV